MFQLFSALVGNTTLSVLDKTSSKMLTTQDSVIQFSFFKTLLCLVFSIIFLPFYRLNLNMNGILVSLLGGICHAASVVLIMHCLRNTLAVYVNLIMSAGIVFPSIVGWCFYGQPFNLLKGTGLLVLIFALGLTLNVRKGGQKNLKSILILFFTYGMLLAVQGGFSKVCPNGSKFGFSAIMYGFSAVILGFVYFLRPKSSTAKFGSKLLLICAITAALNLVVNILITNLSVVFDAVVVFPVVHGLKLIAITLLSPILWKERLKPVQIFGSFLSILCIVILSV